MSEKPVSPDSHWSWPANSGSGFVWFGKYAAKPSDYDALNKMMGYEAPVQEQSVVGRYHPDWNSAWYVTVEPHRRPGGKGSRPYEAQWCGDGVRFIKERIWHFNDEGNMVKEVPANCGAYHRVYDGDGYLNYAGPTPGSEADTLLGTQSYNWDEDYEWYYVGEQKKLPWWEGDCPTCGHHL